jgi:hypothetical protein
MSCGDDRHRTNANSRDVAHDVGKHDGATGDGEIGSPLHQSDSQHHNRQKKNATERAIPTTAS